jgi:hypothetical protein
VVVRIKYTLTLRCLAKPGLEGPADAERGASRLTGFAREHLSMRV